MQSFIWGQTARFWFRVKNPLTGEYYDPDTSIKAAVYNPSKAVVLEGQDMTKYATGIFYYDYDTSQDTELGVYIGLSTGLDTSAGTVMDSDEFLVKAVP